MMIDTLLSVLAWVAMILHVICFACAILVPLNPEFTKKDCRDLRRVAVGSYSVLALISGYGWLTGFETFMDGFSWTLAVGITVSTGYLINLVMKGIMFESSIHEDGVLNE